MTTSGVKRIALISEHASPLAALGGTDAGGQNVYVAQVARHLARLGYAVDVFTRRDAPHLPEVLEWVPGVRVVHVPAGPAAAIPKEQLLPLMPEFTRFMAAFMARGGQYDLLHANFWMSGLVAADLRRLLGVPFVITFHALGKVLVCGNGGSAADAQHFAAELVGRFRLDGRRGLPVLALTADTAMLTAWSNDVGFDDVFARQVEAFGCEGDLLLAISTSGRSPNIVAALQAARARGLSTVALLGGRGGDALALADLPLLVASADTPRIQGVHILALHLICELVEERIGAGLPAHLPPAVRLNPPGATSPLISAPVGKGANL